MIILLQGKSETGQLRSVSFFAQEMTIGLSGDVVFDSNEARQLYRTPERQGWQASPELTAEIGGGMFWQKVKAC